MKLITGGAYQGKLDFALKTFKLAREDVYVCSQYCPSVDFRPCIYELEEFSLSIVTLNDGPEPLEYFRQHKSEWNNSIIIATDISCGVVPMDALEREWREAHGRLMNYLSGEADTVIRLFLGIPEILKGKV